MKALCEATRIYGPLVGRILLALIFIISGFGKITGFESTVGYIASKGLPLPQLGARWIMLAPAGAAISISLVAAREPQAAGVETGIRFETADAEATHRTLRERGVAVGDLLRWPGAPPMFQAQDVDGNRFEVVQAAG